MQTSRGRSSARTKRDREADNVERGMRKKRGVSTSELDRNKPLSW